MTSRRFTICVLTGDGIGPEVMPQALRVLDAIGVRYGVDFDCEEALLGGAAIDAVGTPLPDETLAAARSADAVLLAAVGGPKWDANPDVPNPEQGLFGVRKGLGLYANLRPVRVCDALVGASTLKPEVIRGTDLLIVRELTGGLYFGPRAWRRDVAGAGADGASGQEAFDTLLYREFEVERIINDAYRLARGRRGRVCSVDKFNVLDTSRMWREVAHRVAAQNPDIQSCDMLVDNAALQLVRNPRSFDVIVTENTFGDILSDEAAVLAGSLGMLASASLGEGPSLFEPCHGSAPDIAGQGIANPIAQILSVELMLRLGFGMTDAADDVARAVDSVLDEGWRTGDIADAATAPDMVVGTERMGDLVVAALG